MNREEFSNAFTTMLNSYGIPTEFGEKSSIREVTLNEYEKSVFLSKAQEELAMSLYNGKNPFGDTFEGTEELRRGLSNLICEASLTPGVNSNNIYLGIGLSQFFTLPDGTGDKEAVWFITYEAVNYEGGKCEGIHSMEVYPVTQDEYHKLKNNPFRGANDRRALRLDLSDNIVEIICKYPIESYYVRYLRKPKPIILQKLPEGLTIEGQNEPCDCELHEPLHQKILDRAVILALQSRGIKINN